MDYVYIINHHYSCEDPYYSPYTRTMYIFKTEQEAFEKFFIMEEEEKEWKRKYTAFDEKEIENGFGFDNDNYYEIKKYPLDKIGEKQEPSETIFISIKKQIQKNGDKFEIVNRT